MLEKSKKIIIYITCGQIPKIIFKNKYCNFVTKNSLLFKKSTIIYRIKLFKIIKRTPYTNIESRIKNLNYVQIGYNFHFMERSLKISQKELYKLTSACTITRVI